MKARILLSIAAVLAVAGCSHPSGYSAYDHEDRAALGATDPVCGMKVDPQAARTAMHAGTSYYFCSEGCQQKFQNNPLDYTSDRADRTAASDRERWKP